MPVYAQPMANTLLLSLDPELHFTENTHTPFLYTPWPRQRRPWDIREGWGIAGVITRFPGSLRGQGRTNQGHGLLGPLLTHGLSLSGRLGRGWEKRDQGSSTPRQGSSSLSQESPAPAPSSPNRARDPLQRILLPAPPMGKLVI